MLRRTPSVGAPWSRRAALQSPRDPAVRVPERFRAGCAFGAGVPRERGLAGSADSRDRSCREGGIIAKLRPLPQAKCARLDGGRSGQRLTPRESRRAVPSGLTCDPRDRPSRPSQLARGSRRANPVDSRRLARLRAPAGSDDFEGRRFATADPVRGHRGGTARPSACAPVATRLSTSASPRPNARPLRHRTAGRAARPRSPRTERAFKPVAHRQQVPRALAADPHSTLFRGQSETLRRCCCVPTRVARHSSQARQAMALTAHSIERQRAQRTLGADGPRGNSHAKLIAVANDPCSPPRDAAAGVAANSDSAAKVNGPSDEGQRE